MSEDPCGLQAAAHDRLLRRLQADARGIDPDLEPPSLEALLAGTEFADVLPPAQPATRTAPTEERHA